MLAEIQSGDAVLLKTLIARVRDEEADPNGPKHKQLQRQLLQAMQDGSSPAPNRAAIGAALAEVGDPRFRPDAFYLPDEPLLGFIHIPAGRFTMGSDRKKDAFAREEEQSQIEVELEEFYMARYPVTVAQFKNFVETSGYKPNNPKCLDGLSNHPVVKVTWYDAIAYCNWLANKLHNIPNVPPELRYGWQVTLPSEAEWERAARGTDGRIYPWGNEFDPNKANTRESGVNYTSAVGCFPSGVSQDGLHDMSGNVWEWTNSMWSKDLNNHDLAQSYSEHPDEWENLNTCDDTRIVIRGGSWYYNLELARCAFRGWSKPDFMLNYRGFRISLSPL